MSPASTRRRYAIGIDVGGSGIKGALVDTRSGTLVTPRLRVPTPVPSAPAAVIRTMKRLVSRIALPEHEADAPVGVGFPTVVIDGVTRSASNVDPEWIGYPADEAMTKALGRPVTVVNDADAAGVAEMRFGAGRGQMGTVILLTLGTGTGSAVFVDGRLVPNTELGQMEIRGRRAERRSAAVARTKRGLSWRAWATDLDEHLEAINVLFSPRLFIIGGGVSKDAAKYIPRLTVKPTVVAAEMRNDAGIVGAAMVAAEHDFRTRGAAIREDRPSP